ncbi:glycosyltransferase family 4 protein [Zoogloea sp.]|uniref:glycosyltransferase family 4 protein n=1 Tax=Zoogloea sp. TaxID=49181 RepID=UPI0035AE715A
MINKVLFVHNYYGSASPSGENQVFEAEANLVAAQGVCVERFVKSSDSIRQMGAVGALIGALSTPWNPFSAAEIRKKALQFRPDVVHVHNTFPLISPSIFTALRGICARVLTLHNYRLFCSAAIPMRGGEVCIECIEKRSSLPSLRYGCYRGSRLATLPLAANIGLSRALKIWQNDVDAFVVLSEFQRDLVVAAGLPEKKVYVKPNFYPGCPSVVQWGERGNYAVFVGRLTPEKGVDILLDSWKSLIGRCKVELRVIGSGPLLEHLKHKAVGLPITFMGQLSSEDAQRQIASAKLLILPSICYEGFPMVVREAYAFGTPVAASDLGPLSSIVKNNISGVLFRAGDFSDICEKISQILRDDETLKKLSSGAREEFEKFYTEENNWGLLRSIYEASCSDVK